MIRAKCDSCGAVLKKARQRGKYVCEHCGTIYYENIPRNVDWDNDFDDSPPPRVNQPLVLPVDKEFSTPTRSTNRVWITLGFLVMVGGLFIALLSGTFTGSKGISSRSLVKPEMLSLLPLGEKVGVQVPYDGWELVVNPEFDVEDNNLFFEFTIRNWHDGSQTLRYAPNAILIYDDLGNTYPIDEGGCTIDSQYLDRQIKVEPNQVIEFSSRSSWCDSETSIPVYKGVIPLEAKHLYLHFSAFGVFSNISFVFDL